MKKTMLALAIFAAASQGAIAQESKPVNKGYLQSSSGVVRSGFGECWRTGSWTESDRTPECDKMPAVVVDKLPEVKKPEVPRAEKRDVAPLTERLTLEGAVHFEFDKSDLSAQGKVILDDMISKSKAGFASVDVVTVSGHADRLGEAKYNHGLALRRAVAVSGYLATHGIPARALTVREYGEDRPLVSCDGVKGQKALVSCLAPNRRAEIVIEITRKR